MYGAGAAWSRFFLPRAIADPSRSEPDSALGPWLSGAGAAQISGGSASQHWLIGKDPIERYRYRSSSNWVTLFCAKNELPHRLPLSQLNRRVGGEHVNSPLITSLYSQPMIYLCYISDMQDNPVQPAHLPAVHHPVYGGECGRAGHGAAAPAGHPASCSGRLSSASSSSTREPEQFLVSSRLFPNLGSRLWLRV